MKEEFEVQKGRERENEMRQGNIKVRVYVCVFVFGVLLCGSHCCCRVASVSGM